jgi:hypothetical protein
MAVRLKYRGMWDGMGYLPQVSRGELTSRACKRVTTSSRGRGKGGLQVLLFGSGRQSENPAGGNGSVIALVDNNSPLVPLRWAAPALILRHSMRGSSYAILSPVIDRLRKLAIHDEFAGRQENSASLFAERNDQMRSVRFRQ